MGITTPPFNLVWVTYLTVEVHTGTKTYDLKNGEKETKRRSRWHHQIHAVPLEPRLRPRSCMSLHWPSAIGAEERTRKPEFLLALSLRWKLGRRQLHWVGAGLLLSQDLTLAEEPWRWPQSTSGLSSFTLRNLIFLLLVVMVGRGMLLPPRLQLETQLSHRLRRCSWQMGANPAVTRADGWSSDVTARSLVWLDLGKNGMDRMEKGLVMAPRKLEQRIDLWQLCLQL